MIAGSSSHRYSLLPFLSQLIAHALLYQLASHTVLDWGPSWDKTVFVLIAFSFLTLKNQRHSLSVFIWKSAVSAETYSFNPILTIRHTIYPVMNVCLSEKKMKQSCIPVTGSFDVKNQFTGATTRKVFGFSASKPKSNLEASHEGGLFESQVLPLHYKT